MKVEIIEPGVHDKDGKEVNLGAEIEVKGDVIPAWLVGKAVKISGGKTSVTNPAKGALPSGDASSKPE